MLAELDHESHQPSIGVHSDSCSFKKAILFFQMVQLNLEGHPSNPYILFCK